MQFFEKLLGRLERKTVNRTSDYFGDAICVYSINHDPTVRMAALAAAKKASRDGRASMVEYLRAFACDEADDDSLLLDQLADESAIRDWTIRDAVSEGSALAEFDLEYARALDMTLQSFAVASQSSLTEPL